MVISCETFDGYLRVRGTVLMSRVDCRCQSVKDQQAFFPFFHFCSDALHLKGECMNELRCKYYNDVRLYTRSRANSTCIFFVMIQKAPERG